jgi:hypothetical protein
MYFYASAISCFFHSNRRVWEDVLLFEDILSSPADVARQLLAAVEAPPEELKAAMDAAKIDSQVQIGNFQYVSV